MTFTQIKSRVMSFCGLSSTEADTRVGISINQHYKRVTASLGLDPVRFVTRSDETSDGVRTMTFTDIEKIDRIIDVTGEVRLLTETDIHTIRSMEPAEGEPSRWAVQNTHADSVTVVFDNIPDAAYSLQADGTSTVGDLSGSDEPLFAESFHDILSFLVISEELLRKEKIKLAQEFASGNPERPGRAESAINELRFKLADSPTREMRQASVPQSFLSGGTSGGSVAESLSFLQAGTGAVLRTMQAKVREQWLSVTDFGATGDGVTDDTATIQLAIDACEAVDGGVVFFPAGTYKTTSQLLVDGNNVVLQGNGMENTVILFAPTANGTCLKYHHSGGLQSFYPSLRDIALQSSDITYTKVMLETIDCDQGVFWNVEIKKPGGGIVTGGTGSIGIKAQGRETVNFKGIQISADKPIVLAGNPNSTIDIDHHRFEDLYLIGGSSYPLVTVETGVNVTNLTFDGYQAWVGGTDGLYWVDTTTAEASSFVSINNVRWEQGTSATGYCIRIEHNTTLQHLAIRGCRVGGTVRGIKLRNVRWATVENYGYESTGVSFDADSTVYPLTLNNCFALSGSTASIGATLRVSVPTTVFGSDNILPASAVYTSGTGQATTIDSLAVTTLLTLTAGQIAFPASQSASADANTLDDYEEGTFTPTIGGATSESGQAYSNQAGTYTKIGNRYFVSGNVTLSTLGTITGAVRIKGLPGSFSAGSAAMGYWSGLTSNAVQIALFPTATTAAELYFLSAPGTGLTAMAQADLSNTSRFNFSFSYSV